jgi:hypothetical protein
LILTLLPLVLWAAAQRKLPLRDYCIGALLCAAAILLWLVPTARPAGGLLPYLKFVRDFFAYQASSAARLNRQFSSYPLLYMTWKSASWAFLSAITWIWIVPFTWKRQECIQQKRTLWFLAFWLVPGFVFSSVVHINSSGHALATVTAVCMIGGMIIASIRSDFLFITALVIASLGNFYIFEHPIIPFDDASVLRIRYQDRYLGQMTEELLGLRHFKQLVLVTDNSSLNWRTMHYYLPDTPLLDISGDHSGALLYTGGHRPTRLTPNDTVKLPPCGIIAWIVDNPQRNLIPQVPSAVIPGWQGLVTLTRSTPALNLTVSGMHVESDAAACPQAPL